MTPETKQKAMRAIGFLAALADIVEGGRDGDL